MSGLARLIRLATCQPALQCILCWHGAARLSNFQKLQMVFPKPAGRPRTLPVSFVIQSETESFPSATPRNIGIKGDRSFQKTWALVLKDYADQLRTARLLARNIPTEATYELLPEREIRAIFKYERRWEAFYKLYPLSRGGYYWFSPVGFDPQKPTQS
jgi:hypothetical protein